jgi:hypothetical protein
MTRSPLLGVLFLAASCGAAPINAVAQNAQEEASVNSELVAVEFRGSRRSLDRIASEAASLGWRIDVRDERALRILPPPNYDPDRHFGPLLDRIGRMGLTDIGLRLIGPNGPVGPEG